MEPPDKTHSEQSDEGVAKKPYRKPVVQVYGNLADITAAKKAGKKNDNPSQQPAKTFT